MASGCPRASQLPALSRGPPGSPPPAPSASGPISAGCREPLSPESGPGGSCLIGALGPPLSPAQVKAGSRDPRVLPRLPPPPGVQKEAQFHPININRLPWGLALMTRFLIKYSCWSRRAPPTGSDWETGETAGGGWRQRPLPLETRPPSQDCLSSLSLASLGRAPGPGACTHAAVGGVRSSGCVRAGDPGFAAACGPVSLLALRTATR